MLCKVQVRLSLHDLKARGGVKVSINSTVDTPPVKELLVPIK